LSFKSLTKHICVLWVLAVRVIFYVYNDNSMTINHLYQSIIAEILFTMFFIKWLNIAENYTVVVTFIFHWQMGAHAFKYNCACATGYVSLNI